MMSLIVVVALGLAACDKTNYETSLFRELDESNSTLVTDAKQRIVFRRTVQEFAGETIKTGETTKKPIIIKQIVCAEPSPDIAQAFSEVLKIAESLDRSISDPPDGGNAQNSGSTFLNSYAGSIVQLGERLAVIQLFRDRMYRACEAYANGAIDETAYTLMLARNDKTMATLLTAEMAAGAFGRSLARIGSTAEFVGTNPEERAEKHRNIIRLTDELKNIAEGSHEDRLQMAADKSDELIKEYTELLALDLSTARIAASSSITGSKLGEIVGRNSTSGIAVLTDEISDIHQAFLDDPGLEPLIDACLTALARITLTPNQAEDVENELESIRNSARSIAEIDSSLMKIENIKIETRNRDGVDIGILLDQSSTKILSSFGVHVDANSDSNESTIDMSELETQIEIEQQNKLTKQSEIRQAEIKIYGVMLAASNPFAGFCTTELLGDLSERGFIKRMLESRLELRKLDDRVKFKHLEICEKMLSDLPPNSDLAGLEKVIEFCSKT